MIRIENPSTGGGNGYIPELTSDPISPQAETAWILRQGAGASVTGGGTIRAFLGLGFPYLTVGSGGASTYTYQFSYRTLEATTKRVTIS
jgi:hypothetical protein